MPIDRTTIFRGPGHITWDGVTLVSVDDIVCTLIKDTFDVPVSGYGSIDKRRAGMRVEVQARPARWTDLAKLLPYATTQPGQSIYGASDKPLIIIPRDGALSGITVTNAAITGLPNLRLGVSGTPMQGITWTGIVANNQDPANIDNFVTTAAVGALPSVNLTDLKTGRYSATWGGVLPTFASAEGFEVSFELSLQPVVVDGEGVVDMTMESLTARCTTTPRGWTVAQLLTAIGGGAPGAAEVKNDLVITGPANVTLHGCLFRQAQTRYGSTAERVGAVEFETVRSIATNALSALWTVS